jgi:hypothetical protein
MLLRNSQSHVKQNNMDDCGIMCVRYILNEIYSNTHKDTDNEILYNEQ